SGGWRGPGDRALAPGTGSGLVRGGDRACPALLSPERRLGRLTRAARRTPGPGERGFAAAGHGGTSRRGARGPAGPSSHRWQSDGLDPDPGRGWALRGPRARDGRRRAAPARDGSTRWTGADGARHRAPELPGPGRDAHPGEEGSW